ncbi:MAG TPA: transglycosylase domain-containing protein [Anaerolineales bacterium]|nr:transglycosylase domain-containing protein [Anaerolineales bacterium]
MPEIPAHSDEQSVNRFRRLLSTDEDTQPVQPEGQPEPAGAPDGSPPPADQAALPAVPPEPGVSPLPTVEPPVEPSPALQPPPVPRENQTPLAVTLPPPPPLGITPQHSPPALGTQGMPLPRRVDEFDLHATRVSPSAVSSRPAARPVRPVPPPVVPTPPVVSPPPAPPRAKVAVDWRGGLGCLLRMALLGLLALIIIGLLGGSFVLYEYYSIASTLPSVDDLRQRASSFETTRIYDRNNNLLYEMIDPNAGRRTYVSLDKISPLLVAATVATEDQEYYSHPGFDWLAIVRAFWQNAQGGETVSGASTITQQLARILLLSPEERYEQSYMRKVREALLAAEITRRYSKDEILELYLNEINYGNLAYGVEAAAFTYFGVSANNLTLPQAAFLAGLPQSPSVYDVYTNREATLTRMQQVLTLMYDASTEDGCIYVSNSPERVCLTVEEAVSAYRSLDTYQFKSPDVEMRYPHWVMYVRTLLEAQYDAQTIYRSGFSVYTTLDPGLQDAAQQIVAEQVAALAVNNATNGALVAIRPSTGEILAMVGSADFYNEAIDGQVNMALSPTRQPGSSIKPLTYLAAFERGWTPSTLIWDVPSEFPPSGDPNDPREPYSPVNYDGRFHGPVSVRSALANSYNIPAVKTLQFTGIFDDPATESKDGLVGMASRLGITTFTRPDYGLALTLGGGEVSLMEMTGAYAVLANGGRRVAPVAITRILDHNGELVYEYQVPAGEQVVRSEHAYLLWSILSDNEARTPAFGANSVLNLPFLAAAKTGTTNDYRDNWTMGYTPDIAVGVWVGNSDYTPMQNTSGLTGAAPIWASFMQNAVQRLTGGNPTPYQRPAGIVDRVVCAVSGTEPSQWCPSQRAEIYAADQPPLPKEQDLWAKVPLDTWTNLRASAACADFISEEFVLNVTDVWAVTWLKDTNDGRNWAQQMGFNDPIRFAPPRECRAEDPRPFLAFPALGEGQTITASPLDVYALAYASADFKDFSLWYGLGDKPVEWIKLMERDQPAAGAEMVHTWDLKDIPAGTVTLRLLMHSIRDTEVERLLHLNIQVPTATLTPTPTVTPSPSLTPTLDATFTPTPSPVPNATDTPPPTSTVPPSSTPPASETPSPSNTPTPSEVPTEGPTLTPTVEVGGG